MPTILKPGQRKLLRFLLALALFVVANSTYLYIAGRGAELTTFYQLMLISHLVGGLLLLVVMTAMAGDPVIMEHSGSNMRTAFFDHSDLPETRTGPSTAGAQSSTAETHSQPRWCPLSRSGFPVSGRGRDGTRRKIARGRICPRHSTSSSSRKTDTSLRRNAIISS